MISARLAEESDRGHCCRSCTRPVKRGQPILVIKLGSNVPYDARYQFIHGTCIREALEEMPMSVTEEEFAKARAEYLIPA